MLVPCLSRRFGWLALVLGFLLWPAASYADQHVYADFDGDGQRDHAAFDPTHASMLRVWLSSNPRADVLHSRFHLLRLAAIDLDGDGRPELVATDRRAGLHVWRAGRGRFRLDHHRRTTTPHATHRGPGRTVEDGPSSPDDSAPSRAYGNPADLDACPPEVAWASPETLQIRPVDRRLVVRHVFDPTSPRAPPSLAS
ncbi:MAG: VCBS repeat-containing protein [Acidobacteriota bacterium]